MRFVVLRHELPPGSQRASHWDLMLEHGPSLRTWALDELPTPGRSLVATRLSDHRPLYLDYEGPVAQGRGAVARWDAGSYTLDQDAAGEIIVRIEGDKLAGRLVLTSLDDAGRQWAVLFDDAAGAGDSG